MIPMPIWSLPTIALVALLMCGGTWLMGRNHGVSTERAAQVERQLAAANSTIADMKKENKVAEVAGVHQDVTTNRINVDTSAIGRALQDALARVPPNSDPIMPVWFVRLFDRSASRQVRADPYPGKSDGDPSDIRLSQAGAMRATNFGKCELNRNQLVNLIAHIRDANARREKIEPEGLLERLGIQ